MFMFNLKNLARKGLLIDLMLDGYQCPRVINHDFTSTIELQDNYSCFFHRKYKDYVYRKMLVQEYLKK